MSPSKTTHQRPLGQKLSAARNNKRRSGILRWWPLLVGITMAPFTVRAVQILVLDGQWYAKALEPWPFLLDALPHPLPMNNLLAGILLWIQFPLYGFMLVSLHRIYHWITCLVSLALIHILAVVMLFTLATS
jgi:hypothetical protein